jgi:hypothetical protein
MISTEMANKSTSPWVLGDSKCEEMVQELCVVHDPKSDQSTKEDVGLD